jgi:hypothetical protein
VLRKRKGTQLVVFIPTGKSKYFNYLPTQKYTALNYLIFTAYFIILCWLLLRVPFIKNAGIKPGTLLWLFLFKIIAGLAIGWIAIHIYGPGNDYWDINDYAREESQLLISNPAKYFTNLFTSDYEGGYSGIFSAHNSYWNDLKGNIIIKMVSVFNIFSRGDYYINSLFFNFVIFFGHIIFYRLFIKVFPGRDIPVIIGCFLLPSTIYFASGIHKDGMVFLMLAVLIFSTYQSLAKEKFTSKRITLVIISLIFLFLLRSVVVLALLPALFAWILSAKTKRHAGLSFALVYIGAGLLFFTAGSFTNKIKPLDLIVSRQTEYLSLQGAATQIKLTPLQPTFKSFARNAPEALSHSLLRPYLWETSPKTLMPLALELFLYQVLLVLFIFFRRWDINSKNGPFLFFAVFFTLTIFLMIGYVVPNLGSIVRYRSLYLPLLITPLLCLINWQKLTTSLNIKKY